MHVVRGFAVTAIAALLSVQLAKLLFAGSFLFGTIAGQIGFSLELGVAAFVGYCLLGYLVTAGIGRLTNPGFLLMTLFAVFGYAAGAMALSVITGVVFMTAVTTVLFSLVATGVFWLCWGVGYCVGHLPAVSTFMPQRRAPRA